jgi:hypothetical protein
VEQVSLCFVTFKKRQQQMQQQLDALEEAKVCLLLQARTGIQRMVLEVCGFSRAAFTVIFAEIGVVLLLHGQQQQQQQLDAQTSCSYCFSVIGEATACIGGCESVVAAAGTRWHTAHGAGGMC